MLVRDVILRDLADEPDPVIRVDATAKLGTDVREYVLTDRLAQEFARIIEAVLNSVKPPGSPTAKIGVWISGFFGSGKSHFAKLAGHLLAGTSVGGDTTRELFKAHLHAGRPADDHLAGILQQAESPRLACHLVPFDIRSFEAPGTEHNVGLIFLRAFHRSLGLSARLGIAEAELDLQGEGKYEDFVDLYRERTGRAWSQDKDLALATARFAECLAELLPSRHPTVAEARQNLDAAAIDLQRMFDVDRTVDRLLRWLEIQPGRQPLVFVADEVGGWAGRNLDRIEQVRAFVETAGQKGQGQIWLLATSQERLSELVGNITDDKDYLQRLEARFQTNIHLESSEVGAVIEERILRKRPGSRAELEQLWQQRQPLLRDIAEPPGLELQANYPRPERDRFVQDYPFLPYQLQAAADLFGGMRGVKISSGARSMIKVAFDATRDLADESVGALVTWDRIFDSANSDNEFSDEQYLGSQGLEYIATADRDVSGLAFARPSRILKVLWLIEHSPRIPRTESNLARLLAGSTDCDVLLLERQVAEKLAALEQHNFVRREVATGQWKFLTQDEVTVEKIVKRLSDDLRAARLRQELTGLTAKRLTALYGGWITHGVSGTRFDCGLSLAGNPLKNDTAPVQLTAVFEGSPAGDSALVDVAATLDSPRVTWLLPAMPKLEERLRRALAIEALPNDDEFRRIATERTRAEAEKLLTEAVQLRAEAEGDADALFQTGRLIYAGRSVQVDPNGPNGGGAKAHVEEALADRIDAVYTRFSEGDRRFQAANIDRLFAAAPGDRMALDPQLGIFGVDGHVNGGNVLVEELTAWLRSSMKTAGGDVIDAFSRPPFGWPPDLLRYLAAAMFVDGKVSAADRSGKPFDDPRNPQARALFGTLPFRTARLLAVEDPLTPAESDAARDLLTALGRKPADGGEIALREATLLLCGDLGRRAALVQKGETFGLPLPAIFDQIAPMIAAVQDAGSREKVVRALLAAATEFRQADAALKQLEDFDRASGFEQFRRSRLLLRAAIEAGLKDDPAHGASIAEAEGQTEAIIRDRRVLDDFAGAFQKYRVDVLEAFRSTYAPQRQQLHEQMEAARKAILAMPEFEALSAGDRAVVRAEFLGGGRPLQEISLPELRNEEQLLAANSQFNLAYLRQALANLDIERVRARARVIDLYAAEMAAKGRLVSTATWSAAQAFAGRSFRSEEEVDAAFDAEKDRIKALIRDGKSVEVV